MTHLSRDFVFGKAMEKNFGAVMAAKLGTVNHVFLCFKDKSDSAFAEILLMNVFYDEKV